MANELKIELTVDDKGTVRVQRFAGQVGRSNDEIQRSTDKTARSVRNHWESSFSAMKVAAAAGLAGALYAVQSVTRESLKAASDLEEVSSKFNVVFEGQTKLAESWAKTLVDSYLMSTRESKQYLSSVQDLLVPMGMAADQAGKMSFEVVKLSADLGSFNNMPTAKVMDDIQSALVGNYETMKKYGVVLNATVVQEKALAMGLAKTKDELTAGEKAQAAYALMVQGSEKAVGDVARTSGSYANQMKQLHANVEILHAILGQALLPTATDIVKGMNEWIKANETLIKQKVPEYIQDIADVAKITYQVINKIVGPFQWIAKEIKTISEIIDNLPGWAQALLMGGIPVGKIAAGQIENLANLPLIEAGIVKTTIQQAGGGAVTPPPGGGLPTGGAGGGIEELTKAQKKMADEVIATNVKMYDELQKIRLSELEYAEWALEQEYIKRRKVAGDSLQLEEWHWESLSKLKEEATEKEKALIEDTKEYQIRAALEILKNQNSTAEEVLKAQRVMKQAGKDTALATSDAWRVATARIELEGKSRFEATEEIFYGSLNAMKGGMQNILVAGMKGQFDDIGGYASQTWKGIKDTAIQQISDLLASRAIKMLGGFFETLTGISLSAFNMDEFWQKPQGRIMEGMPWGILRAWKMTGIPGLGDITGTGQKILTGATTEFVNLLEAIPGISELGAAVSKAAGKTKDLARQIGSIISGKLGIPGDVKSFLGTAGTAATLWQLREEFYRMTGAPQAEAPMWSKLVGDYLANLYTPVVGEVFKAIIGIFGGRQWPNVGVSGAFEPGGAARAWVSHTKDVGGPGNVDIGVYQDIIRAEMAAWQPIVKAIGAQLPGIQFEAAVGRKDMERLGPKFLAATIYHLYNQWGLPAYRRLIGGEIPALDGVQIRFPYPQDPSQWLPRALDKYQRLVSALGFAGQVSGMENPLIPQSHTGTPYVDRDRIYNVQQGQMIIDQRSAEVLRRYGIGGGAMPTSSAKAEINELHIHLDFLDARSAKNADWDTITRRYIQPAVNRYLRRHG